MCNGVLWKKQGSRSGLEPSYLLWGPGNVRLKLAAIITFSDVTINSVLFILTHVDALLSDCLLKLSQDKQKCTLSGNAMNTIL